VVLCLSYFCYYHKKDKSNHHTSSEDDSASSCHSDEVISKPSRKIRNPLESDAESSDEMTRDEKEQYDSEVDICDDYSVEGTELHESKVPFISKNMIIIILFCY